MQNMRAKVVGRKTKMSMANGILQMAEGKNGLMGPMGLMCRPRLAAGRRLWLGVAEDRWFGLSFDYKLWPSLNDCWHIFCSEWHDARPRKISNVGGLDPLRISRERDQYRSCDNVFSSFPRKLSP